MTTGVFAMSLAPYESRPVTLAGTVMRELAK